MHRHAQIKFQAKEFKPQLFFGGSLTTKRAHRTARPLSTKHPIHLVLRSSRATGEFSFWNKANKQIINHALKKQANKWGVKVISCANVGNHLHIMLKLSNRFSFNNFIRALTGSIALQITKWNKNLGSNDDSFWDFRPYTRIVAGVRAWLTMKDYMLINQIEGLGGTRFSAKMILVEGSRANSS